MEVRELQAAQDELVRKERLAVLSHLADSVGHELRNPLGVMSNVVYLLETMCEHADDTAKEYLGILKAQIDEADRIISDLLDAVRTPPPQVEEVAVADLVGDVLRKYPVPAAVATEVEIPALLPHVHVDPRQMRQALHNLVSNAVDAMAEGGSLKIRAGEQGGDIVIAVADTGVGMTAQQLARLFQPLVTSKAGRIGLGLVVVKNFTEANGGRVEVASEAGKGTTVTLTLPVVRVA